jgi:hypothetical protein
VVNGRSGCFDSVRCPTAVFASGQRPPAGTSTDIDAEVIPRPPGTAD